MNYKPFERKDYVNIELWHVLRGLAAPIDCETPEIGVVAYIDQTNVAIGFLRRLEGGYAQIDGLIANPKAGKNVRDEALDGVLTYLINKAKELKIKGICSYSNVPQAVERSKKHGFTVLDHKVLGLIITNDQ